MSRTNGATTRLKDDEKGAYPSRATLKDNGIIYEADVLFGLSPLEEDGKIVLISQRKQLWRSCSD